MPLNTEVRVEITYDGAKAKFYVNGAEEASDDIMF